MPPVLQELPDGELLRTHLETGSQAAMALLVDRHLRLVRCTCRRLLGDDQAADDAAQEVFITLVRKARALTGEESLARWLYYTARNRAWKHRRAQARRRRHEALAGPTRVVEAPAPDPEWGLALPRLDDALAALPNAQRDAIILRFFRGLSLADCAREAGCPLRTLQTRVSRGLARLRDHLQSQGAPLSTASLSSLLAQASSLPAPSALATAIAAAAAGTTAQASWVALGGAVVWGSAAGLVAALAVATTIAHSHHPPPHAVVADPPTTDLRPMTAAAPTESSWLSRSSILIAPADIHALAFSPDGTVLASGDLEGSVALWDVATGQRRLVLRDRAGRVTRIAYAPDGGLIASAAIDGGICLWRPQDGHLVRRLDAHSTVWALAFSPDGQVIASGDAAYAITLWQINGTQPPRVLGHHRNELRDILFFPDGATLVSGGNDYAVRWWDVASGRPLGASSLPHTVRSMALSADGRWLAVDDGTRAVQVFDRDRHVVARGPGSAPGAGDMARVAMDPAGEMAASSSDDGTLILWRVADGVELARLALRPDIYALTFSHDGRTIAVGHGGGAIDLIRVRRDGR